MKILLIALLLFTFIGCTVDNTANNSTKQSKNDLIKYKNASDIEIVKTESGISPAGFMTTIWTIKNNSPYTMWNLHCYVKLLDKEKTIIDIATLYFAEGSDIKAGISVVDEGSFFKVTKDTKIDKVDYEFGYNFR